MRKKSGGLLLGAAGVLAAAWAFRRRQQAFAGKLAVVTGGSRGLGLVIARALALRGATVVILARDESELAPPAHGPAQARADIYYRMCDVADRAGVASTIADIEREHGPIDVLIDNADGPVSSIDPATAAAAILDGIVAKRAVAHVGLASRLLAIFSRTPNNQPTLAHAG